jgi:hypothetical protein
MIVQENSKISMENGKIANNNKNNKIEILG